MTRNILASKPRVTRFKINWDDTTGNAEEQIETEEGAAANHPGNGMEFDDLVMEDKEIIDENSLAMPSVANENSNSLAMEC